MHLPTDMEHNNTHNNCNPNVADGINALGTHYKEIIYRDYLNIEPTPAQLNSNLE